MAQNAFAHLVHQLHVLMDQFNLATVIHALLKSRLDSCNAFYLGLHLKSV